MTNANLKNTLNGISQNEFKYFKEELVSQNYTLNTCDEEINDIIDFIGDIEIEKYSLQTEEIGLSTEGSYLTGKKFSVIVKIKSKLTYSSNISKMGVRVLFVEFIKNINIVIPEKINEDYTSELIRARRFTITSSIEELYARKFDTKKIHMLAVLFVNLKFC